MPVNSLSEAVGSGAILLVDKRSGWTSHDVVARTRRAFSTRKVGHAGTLDPLATGLLTIGIGSATRLLTHLVGLDKVYTATIRLGQATVTDDSLGAVTGSAAPKDIAALTALVKTDESRLRELLKRAMADFTGEIMQVPTAVSAIKVQGKRAYDLVRQGKEVNLKARRVTVHRFELGGVREAQTENGDAVLDIDVTAEVSSGTYIRALARDLGAALGVYGHLVALRRESVGPFSVNSAVCLDTLDAEAQKVAAGKAADPANLPCFSPAETAAQLFPVVKVQQDEAIALGHGKQLETTAPDAELAAAVALTGRLVALVAIRKGKMRVLTGFLQQEVVR
ncbi:tRNA pseudouridine(55) synthase TruB [Canibacter zhoujuaniae]|uniref:tRNA pseudouridine(55) synthase TruB n=1 Tax=Canibacter zhoujuaniae TaxID=2708343 RepID=UPI001421A1E9|nr:tRNA pseudouridine(55) synthase TruB [Canibacter zhoujuaniae]